MSKKAKRLLMVALFLLMAVLTLSFNQPIIFVRENADDAGSHLEIFDPGQNDFFKVTDTQTGKLFKVSFPVVCERTGLIGFTHHTKSMAAEVYVIEPGSLKPRKVLDQAILEDISPNGSYLLVSGASASPSLYLLDTETKDLEQLTKGYTVSSASFSPDGSYLVFAQMDKKGLMDLYKLSLADRQITQIVNTASWSEYYPSFTKDGSYLMFMTNRTGEWGVDYIELSSDKRYQTNMRGMYPALSSDDAWTALEKNGEIIITRTNGKDEKTLTPGLSPSWISEKNASRFIGKPEKQTSTLHENDERLGSAIIGPSGGIVDIPDRIKVEIPPGTVEPGSSPRELTVYETTIDDISGKVFDIKWEGSPELFSKLVDISIPLDNNMNPDDFCAIDEIDKGLWMVVPSEYDSKTHAISFKTAHFSKKGIISEIGPQQVRKLISGAFGSIGTGIGVIVITGSSQITLPALGIMAVGGYVLSHTGFMDPAVDKGYELYHGINRTFVIDNGISVSWVDDPANPSNLPGEKCLVCVEKETNKLLFAVYDKNTDPQKRAAALSGMFPGSNYKIINIPRVILELAAEMKWIKNYYEKNGYQVPPETDIQIYKMDKAGGWNGTKLEIDSEYFKDLSEKTKASRMVVLAHEYWHSVYQYNGYSPDYKWLDECLATTFESQALPQAGRWYAQSVLPKYEHFYDMYKAEQVAESLRTGFVFPGETGNDADRIKRGYHFWPWGKFLLANQSHEEIEKLLNNEMDATLLSAYFKMFCKAILLQDFEVHESIQEDIDFQGQSISYETISGWPFLQVRSFIAPLVLTTGSSKANISQGVHLKPVPLSMNILKFRSELPEGESPLIIRRSTPDSREELIAMNPNISGNKQGRQNYNDIILGEGVLVVTRDWLNTSSKKLDMPISIINSSVEENWSEYFGYGENPLYAYFLQKPKDLDLQKKDDNLCFTWDEPAFGRGLSAKHCLSEYKIFVADKALKDIRNLNTVSPGKQQMEIAYYQIAGFEKIGIAAVDKHAKDDSGNPLMSEIAWIPIHTANGKWKKISENHSYRFGENLMNSQQGQGSAGSHETGSNRFEINISSTNAKTLNANYATYTGGGETASFIHSWSPLPNTLTPGQKITQTITVADNASSGKNALDLRGTTGFELITGKVKERVEAGGSLYTKYGSWESQDKKTFTWTVPQPSKLEMSFPKQYRLKIYIVVKAQSNETTQGFYEAEYEYQQ